MTRLQTLHVLFVCAALSGCATTSEGLSPAEERMITLADEKAKDARYPVLAPLPSAREVVRGGVPGGPELKAEQQRLTVLVSQAGAPLDTQSIRAVGAELRSMVVEAQSTSARIDSFVNPGDIDFPTPPPLDR